MTVSTSNSGPTAIGGHGHGKVGLLDRIRTSFSGTQRPILSNASPDSRSSKNGVPSTTYSTMGRRVNDNGDSGEGGLRGYRAYASERGLSSIGTDSRPLKHRQSIFRKAGRHAKPRLTSALPPQLPSVVVSEQDASSDNDTLSAAASIPQQHQHQRQQRSLHDDASLHSVTVFSTAASARKRLEYHQRARLSVAQACLLLDQCAKEIKMRGLAMIGIFRPFRSSETPSEVERLIELFLLSSEPDVYRGIFALQTSVSSALARDTLGRPNAEVEFRRKLGYANVHDVVALFKWGLRRLSLQLSDVRSSEQYTWYSDFVDAEKSQQYPASAFSAILLPRLDSAVVPLMRIVFDLMSTVSAHHVNNAMPASRLSRTLGYWLFGRLGNDPAPVNFNTMYAAWERAGQVTEHLLLAFIREQASKIHLMPSRLTELIAGYPHIAPGRSAPSVPPEFAPLQSTALYVETRIENLVVTPSQPRRSPRDTLADAVKARNIDLEASEDLDDWMAIVSSAKVQAKSHLEPMELMADDEENLEMLTTDDTLAETDNIDLHERAMFKDEDVRVLDLTAVELQKRRETFEGRSETSIPSYPSQTAEMIASHDSISSLYSRGSVNSFTTELGPSHPISKSNSTHGGRSLSLAPLSESEDETDDWKHFKSSGFAGGKSVELDQLQFNEKFRPKTELEKAFEEQDRQDAIAALKKNRRNRSRDAAMVHEEARGPPRTILLNVSTTTFYDCFVGAWQDQLLDDCQGVRMPNLLCAQFNQRTANRLLGNATTAISTSALGGQWLIVNETIVPPHPPMPPSPSSKFLGRRASTFWRNGSMKHASRPHGSNGGSDEWGAESSHDLYSSKSRNEDDDRQSLFSIRSGLSAHFRRPGNGLRRMRSMLSARKDATHDDLASRSEVWSDGSIRDGGAAPSAALTQASVIDAEVAELKAAVHADRKRRREQLQQQHQGKATKNIYSPPLSQQNETSIAPSPVSQARRTSNEEPISNDTVVTALTSSTGVPQSFKDVISKRDSAGVQSRTESRPETSMYSARSTSRSQSEDVQDDT